jgi:hypothetical protein
MAILQAIGVAIVLSLGSTKAQNPGGNLPSYLVNVTNYGTIATQWNQVGQLAVKRNNSGPINAAATFFLLSQVQYSKQHSTCIRGTEICMSSISSNLNEGGKPALDAFRQG